MNSYCFFLVIKINFYLQRKIVINYLSTLVGFKPELIQWALDRSGKYPDMLAKKLPKIEEWLAGELSPTLKQLETFSKATYTPIGFLFLPEPPDEQVPIPDFRTMAAEYFDRPSPDLLDTIYICQQRQEWYRDFERTTATVATRIMTGKKTS